MELSRLHGGRMLDKKLKNRKNIMIIFLCASFFVMQFNGIYHVWPDFINICNSLAFDSIALQILMRLAVRFMTNHEEDVNNFDLTILKFYEREEQNMKRRKFLNSRIKLIGVVLKSYMILNGVLFHIPILTSIIISIYYRDFILFAPFHFPFVNHKQLIGFILNEFLMGTATVTFAGILITSELIYFYYTLQILSIGDIFIENIKEFGDEVKNERQEINNVNNLEKISQKINLIKNLRKKEAQNDRKIVRIITDFSINQNFTSLIIKYMQMLNFIAILMNALAIGFSILVVLFFSVPIGISMILIFLLQILLPCVEGAMIFYQNQKILNAVLNFPWYELSNSNQKIWLQFIHQCQNANEFKIIIFGHLNMERFTDIVKSAYSSSMFVLKLAK